MRVAFIGLGVMGFPMAGWLARKGHEVRVHNRSPKKPRRWAVAHEGVACDSVAEAAQGCEAVVLCVGTDDDVRQVVAEALPAMAEGGVIVDHTTTSAVVAREMSDAAEATGHAFVDAPVSGGQAGAESGQLTVMAGGRPEAFARVEPLLGAYAKAARLMGDPGAGQLTKMVNQICIAGVLQGLAEAMHFARAAGLDLEGVHHAISGGAAQSWQMNNRWPTMIAGEFDFGFAVDWMRKDLGLVLDEAGRNGATLEMTSLVDSFYAEVQRMEGGRWDTSSLAVRLNPETLKR